MAAPLRLCAGRVWFPPVSPEAFEVVSECASDDNKDEIALNVFKLPAISIVMGSFTCPPPGLTAECNFFWHGEQGGAEVCRLYRDCGNLTAEVGISGELKGIVREKSCHVANPESCWATSLRQVALTTTDTWGFRFFSLHRQCDTFLLLGGHGVDECSLPTYRDPSSHVWEPKRPVKEMYVQEPQHWTWVAGTSVSRVLAVGLGYR